MLWEKATQQGFTSTKHLHRIASSSSDSLLLLLLLLHHLSPLCQFDSPLPILPCLALCYFFFFPVLFWSALFDMMKSWYSRPLLLGHCSSPSSSVGRIFCLFLNVHEKYFRVCLSLPCSNISGVSLLLQTTIPFLFCVCVSLVMTMWKWNSLFSFYSLLTAGRNWMDRSILWDSPIRISLVSFTPESNWLDPYLCLCLVLSCSLLFVVLLVVTSSWYQTSSTNYVQLHLIHISSVTYHISKARRR